MSQRVGSVEGPGPFKAPSATRGADRRPALRLALGLCGLLFVLLVLVGPASVEAQAPPSPLEASAASGETNEDQLAPDAIAARLAAIRKELAAVGQKIERVGPEARMRAVAESDALDAIEALLVEQLDLAQHTAAALDASVDEGEASASIFLLSQLQDAREERVASVEERRRAVAEARSALAAARGELEAADRARRLARVALERESADEQAAADSNAAAVLRQRELASLLASEKRNLRTLELRDRKRALSLAEAGDGLAARIEAVRAAIARGQGDSASGFKSLLELEADLRRDREQRERELSTVELRIKSVESQLARGSAPEEHLLGLAESLAAHRDTLRHEIALIDARVERLAGRTESWRIWERLLRSESTPEQRVAAAEAMRDRIDELEQAAQRLQIRVEAQDVVAEGLADRLRGLDAASPLHAAIANHAGALARLRAAEQASLKQISFDLRVARRLEAELSGGSGRVDVAQLARRAYRGARDLWNYELTAVDDSPITIGSLLVAMLLLGLGLWASRLVSTFVGRVVEKRFRLDAGAVQSVQTLLFYLLLVSFGLLALQAVHFPLTAFTVLGGALAIGVGFGSQNVMNNFISGLILMLERPVRAHDMVEVDGNHGTIDRIGARSTQIRSTDGRHIIVPNSFFLETNVVNWTLSDDLIRTSVLVGVIYGSPTRLVERLIQQVVDENEEVLPSPAPIILFGDFGDNSLDFEVHFWVKARGPMQKRKVESQVRFAIDDLFREHGLVIAFPQRDVHLDSVRPIEVRMVDGSPGPGSGRGQDE